MTTTYVSPKTNRAYVVTATKGERMVGGFGEPLRPEVFTTYDIYLNGTWVQFALTLEGVADSVAHYENPGPDLGSRFD